jgi:hypothetical protein
MQVAYAEVHELVDRLTPDQAEVVRAMLRGLVSPARSHQPAAKDAESIAGTEPVRRLSFAGMLHSGRSDLAARSEEIIRSELGRLTE